MTHEEAAAILNVSIDANIDEVKKKYRELYSDYQVRLTNAPTANLKKKYQENLQKIEAAFKVLCPGASLDDLQDLPSAEPSHGHLLETTPKRQSRPDEKSTIAPAQGPAKTGLTLPILILLMIAVVSAAAAAFFGLKLLKTDEGAKILEQQFQKAQTEKTSAVERLSLLEQGAFCIQNNSKEPFKITILLATYLKQNGKYATFHSGLHNYPTWEVRPRQKLKLEYVKGGDMIWDGTTLYYAMEVEYKGYKLLVSGTWQDALETDGCFKFNLDG
jgi:hypothetical protein